MPRCFKLKSLSLRAGERLTLSKRHPLRVMTTRRLYPGEHRLTLQINGQDVAAGVFVLEEASAQGPFRESESR